jgi:hypothetical protein
MTKSELSIIEFLITSNATELADLPDWFLIAIETGNDDGMSHELITAATFLFARRQRPGIGYGAARRLMAAYTADPVKCQELEDRINAFRLSCCFERLKRAGYLADFTIGDPFDPESNVAVTLTEKDWQFLNSHPDKDAMRRFRQGRWNLN